MEISEAAHIGNSHIYYSHIYFCTKDLFFTFKFVKTLRQRPHRASETEYLFSVSFPLVGNPSDPESFREKILDSSA
jgi:hypothetical protein